MREGSFWCGVDVQQEGLGDLTRWRLDGDVLLLLWDICLMGMEEKLRISKDYIYCTGVVSRKPTGYQER